MRMLFLLSIFFIGICVSLNNSYAASKNEDYELEEKCSSGAKVRFEEVLGARKFRYNYNNHLNRRLNKCFQWVWSLDGARTQYLYDVNERKYYGMIMIGEKNKILCTELEKSCKSENEWVSFAKYYMEE